MKKIMMILLVYVVLIGQVQRLIADYSFGDWATDNSLPIDATIVIAMSAGITNLEGLTSYTSLQELRLNSNQISKLEADDLVGLNDLYLLSFDLNNISSIETGTFTGMQKLIWLWLSNNPIYTLNLSRAQFQDLTFFTIKSTAITTIDLSEVELSQEAFNFMMDGGGAAYVGIAEKSDITEMSFTSAKLTDVTEFDRMFSMNGLEILDIVYVDFADQIMNDNYNEITDLIDALESRNLNFLTIDNTLYTARKNYFDNWDAGFVNELTIIPDPLLLMLDPNGSEMLTSGKAYPIKWSST
ncbi:MAG: leucine-rich repeat domain-containing protein, partial [Planctomycetota bacterium]